MSESESGPVKARPPWQRRLGCTLFFCIWLFVSCLPFLAVALSIKGELRLGELEGRHWRAFLIEDEDNSGIGIEWARPQWGNSTCMRNSVTFVMWKGSGENSRYCVCEETSGPVIYPDNSCVLPEE